MLDTVMQRLDIGHLVATLQASRVTTSYSLVCIVWINPIVRGVGTRSPVTRRLITAMGHTLAGTLLGCLRYDPSLARLVSLIPMMGIVARKTILDVCQTERVSEYRDLHAKLKQIQSDISTRRQDHISQEDLYGLLDHVAVRPVYRSFISMMLRNERCDQFSGADEVLWEGTMKEVRAALSPREEQLGISYQVLDEDNFAPAAYSIYFDLTPPWTREARSLAHRFANKLERLGVIYPQVQRRKNMSRDTCRRLWEAGFKEREWQELRTVDLEVFAYRTGIRVGGDCEVRVAWKYNELKPRCYYCTGGSAYWASRHVKKLAVALMECIESCKLQRRQHPEDVQYSLQHDEWLALWDMASFTSSLSELRQFLYYIAKNLENDLRVQQHPLRLFDYQLGVIETTADRLLLDYNQVVNVECGFSLERVVAKFFQEITEDDEKTSRMANSGPLGVHGNIGFSTAFHAFHAEAAISKGTGCGVGDDMMGGIKEDPELRLLPHLRMIGDIQETKADILPPLSMDMDYQVSKFVKRRLTRTYQGITLGILYAFPSLADVYGVSDEYHTVQIPERPQLIARFCAQVGAFFWDVYHTGYLQDEERQLIDQVLRGVYSRLGLSHLGSLPGRKHPDFVDRMMFAVPPLYCDIVHQDWAEYLWDSAPERIAVVPTTPGNPLLPPFEPDLEFTCTEGGLMNVLEDIGSLVKIRMLTEWVEVNETNRRRFRAFLEGGNHTYLCRYIGVAPSWIDDVSYSYYTRPLRSVV